MQADCSNRNALEHTHLVHACERIKHARSSKHSEMQTNASLLHNRSHLSILFACHIPSMLENQTETIQSTLQPILKCLLVSQSILIKQ